MSTKVWLSCVGAAFVAGGGIGAWTLSHETVKTVQVDHDVVHDKIVTVTKTVKEPNGSVETDTTSTKDITADDTKNTQTVAPPAAAAEKPKWIVSATAATTLPTLVPAYGVMVQRRLFGPVIVGAQADTGARGMISVGIEF